MVLALLLLTAAPMGPAPVAGLEGIVGWVHLESGEPAREQAVVVLGENVRRGVVTSNEGMFHVSGLARGRYKIVVRSSSAWADVAAPGATVVELVAHDRLAAKAAAAMEPDARPEVPDGLRLEISLARRTYLRGEPIMLEARATNGGSRSLVMVRAVDGSIHGMRAPRYRISVVDHDRRFMVPAFPGFRCGNVNALNPGDIFELRPGESANPFEHWHGGSVGLVDGLPAGRYSVRVQYDYDVAAPQRVVDECHLHPKQHGPPVASPPERITGLVSNEVELEITDSAAAVGIDIRSMPKDWSLSRVPLSGRVLDVGGRPRVGVKVTATGHFPATTTDAEGRYEFELLPGRYKVWIDHGEQERVVEVKEAAITVDFRAVVFSGLCVDPEGRPPHQMTLVPGTQAMPARYGDLETGKTPRVTVGWDGRWCFAKVPNGTHTLFAGRFDEGFRELSMFREVIEISPGVDRSMVLTWPDDPQRLPP